MRILQICSAHEIGGGEIHLVDLANALAQRGHDVFVALSPSSPVRKLLSSVPSENVVELPMRNSFSLATAMKLSRFVRVHEIEIVHAHIARDYPLSALVTGRSNARLVLTRHVLFPLNPLHRLTLRRTMRVIAVSRAVADSLARTGIFDEKRIVTIHNGIDFAKFDTTIRRCAVNRTVRIGMVGHIAPIKGQEDFVHAAALVARQRQNVEFIIAGEDKSASRENRIALEKLIGGLKLDDQVKLIGWQDDVAAFLSTLDVFVSCAHSEPFGISIVEAMAAGIPIVATASEGAREIITDKQTGRLVPVGDA
ncbi:MAG TPA: glycosyltransferase, partial [Pyrinomonadaceae bacterium]|nr:glycosyltransferase [Pyrinomonadaceae bacterium]